MTSASKGMLSSKAQEAKLKDDLLELVDQEKQVRINANVPHSLYHQFKVKCVTNQTTMTDVLIDFMKSYIGGK